MLAGYGDLAERADYAMRNARVVARRAYAALLDGEPPVPDLPDVLAELACAVDRLTAELNREGDLTRARAAIVDVVDARQGHVRPDRIGRGAAALLGHSEQVLVAQIRSIALDLLQATGLSRAEAQAAMRARTEEFTRSFGKRNTISDASGQAACRRLMQEEP